MVNDCAIMAGMTYRIYLRWPNQRVSDKTTTESERVALIAWEELLARSDLNGQSVGAAYTQDGKQLRYHRFDGGSDA